ncbi:Menaquinol-cytochrome c reductase cytochrome b subunit [Caulifigura coniformis]|uniref:Menaquinol-cytochrome c reductase cytochrome b subunit n=1 Tax=Caulifigura coniformis TaxID=2527983 RepID=A0A517SA24_9PLAN|nr:cytochrome b N-terminal domain-containing protein [Caulifigura coniformis]QDT52980.1 Menaquinol-cytochrome c reductase cytochrome b subunit [Caulifigura coniformis]
MKLFLNWLDDRTGYRDLMHEALREHIPGGARWRYVWGSTLTFVFMVQVVTGFALWAGYSPSSGTAWESVYYIQHEMTLGSVLRGVHHFAAQAMVVLMAVHLMQVVIDGAYKAPREMNFWLGLVLMQIVLGLGLTGYLLPWDQKGYYATRVATEIMGSTPGIGPQIQQLAQGGPSYGHHTLTRFFALHAGILPALLVAFLALHIYVFRRHGITAKQPYRKPDSEFWPDQVLMDAVACLAILATLLLLAVWKGAELSAPANPASGFSAARPEWYYLFLFRFLKFGWVSHAGEVTGLGEAFGAVVLPGILMTIIALMPFIARVKGGHKFNVGFLVLVVLGSVGLTGVALYEDWIADTADGRSFRAAVAQAHKDGQRAVALSQAPAGIPPEGAISLLLNDPLTQGPRLFQTRCSDCHRWQGQDGLGNDVVQIDESALDAPAKPVAAKAPDLATFGSRAWIKGLLSNFAEHMKSTENATVMAEKARELPGGTMAEWSKENSAALNSEANKASFEAIVEFLYTQSGRSDALPQNDPKVLAGREIFQSGKLADGELTTACADCHTMILPGETEPLSASGEPILTGYGGKDWLKQMLLNPDAHYGESNAMPAFHGQLSDHELDMITRWIIGEYYLPPEEPTKESPTTE